MKEQYIISIFNCASYLRGEAKKRKKPTLNAFTMSETLAIAFGKTKEEVLNDIVEAGKL